MNRIELENRAIMYGSHEYSIFIKDYKEEIIRLSYEDMFILLKGLYVNAKEGNRYIARLIQIISNFGIPKTEYANIKNNIKFNDIGEVTVYRGLNRFNSKNGSSYTLDKDKAIWFSKRFGDTPKIIEKNVKIKDIIFYYDGRAEKEVFLRERYDNE